MQSPYEPTRASIILFTETPEMTLPVCRESRNIARGIPFTLVTINIYHHVYFVSLSFA